MFSLRTSPALRPRLLARRHVTPPVQQTRSLVTVQQLTEGFLDLAIALPFPPEWPPYSSTIVTVTLLSRLLFTLPVSIWVSKLP
jgi:mitochondrial inner membrane protein COX18